MLHIITFVSTKSLSALKIEQILSSNSDSWYRLSKLYFTYIVHSKNSAEYWSHKLSLLVESNGILFVSKLDVTDYQGWMNNDFWNWINEYALLQ
jgi:hypothetical protein